LRNAAANETSQQRKADALKRLSVVEAFRDASELELPIVQSGW
jgi:DNA-directed RNA polymerase subunit beta'